MSNPRTATIPNRLEAVKILSAKACAELAERTFSPDAVMTAIAAAASEGFSTVTIEPPKPVDLRGTEAWQKAVLWLGQEGFRVEPKELPNKGNGPPAWALVVFW